MDSSAYSHRKGLEFMWISSSWNVHRNPNILFANMLVAILFSSGHLLILEVTNCETKVAGKALCVCKNFKPVWVHPAVLPPAKLPVALCVSVCMPMHVGSQCCKWLCPFSSGSVRMGVCTMFGSALDWKLEKLKAFRRVLKNQHTHITENTWEMRKREIMQHAVTFGSFLPF